MKLFNLFNKVWSANLSHDGFSKEYTKWLDRLVSMYTTVQLWQQGNNYGVMGQKE
jgi:hypothetical protein